MYYDFFGLSKPPFNITPNTNAFFSGRDRGDILQILRYAIIESEGISKVVGEVGTGKTMLCRMLPTTMTGKIAWIYLGHPSLSPIDMLRSVAHDLGIDTSNLTHKSDVMRALHESLLIRYAKNYRVVVLVEEAQSIPLETLEELRLLSNLENQDNKLLHIVLFGQPELDLSLSHPSTRQIRDRVVHNLYLKPFDTEQTHQYLDFKLRAVGYHGPNLFNMLCAKHMCRHANGLLRRINIIADKSLLAAYSQNRHTITIKDVKNAAQESNMRCSVMQKLMLWLKPYSRASH